MKLDKTEKSLTNVLRIIGTILMGGGTLLTFLITVARYGFGIGWVWAEEAIRYSMLAVTFLLAGPVMLNDGNVCMTVVYNNLQNNKTKKRFAIISTIVVLILAICTAYWSIMLWINSGNTTTFSQSFPLRLPYSFIPIGMILLTFYCILKLKRQIAAPPEDYAPVDEAEAELSAYEGSNVEGGGIN